MTLRYAISYLGRLAFCALAFFFGITIGGMAAALLGLPNPDLPPGTDAATLSRYFLPAGLRLIHGVEILADSFVYALALVLLLAPREPAAGWKMAAAHPLQ